jgi:hypothetical protein
MAMNPSNTIKLRVYTNPREAEQRRHSLPIPVKMLNLMAFIKVFLK